MKNIKVFTYKGTQVLVKKHQYGNKRLALELVDLMGLPFTRITVNIPEAELKANEIIVKDYSENEGLLEWLIKHNMVSPPTGEVSTGFVLAPKVQFKDEEFWMHYKEYSQEEFNKLTLEYVL